jgi:hypothetical protein
MGHAERARQVDAVLGGLDTQGCGQPMIIATGYMDAALTAFYLPGRPTVYNAAHQLGSRKSSYDFWEDTNLSSVEILGRDAVLISKARHTVELAEQRWLAALMFDSIKPAENESTLFIGRDYGGLVDR